MDIREEFSHCDRYCGVCTDLLEVIKLLRRECIFQEEEPVFIFMQTRSGHSLVSNYSPKHRRGSCRNLNMRDRFSPRGLAWKTIATWHVSNTCQLLGNVGYARGAWLQHGHASMTP
eukprot:COSAG06_NODE_24734_length_654_cov_0.666667_1_plen_115_part_10